MAKKKKVEEPERRWFMSRDMAYGPGFWTDYNEVAINVGTPRNKFHGADVPESQITIGFKVWPFKLIVFWHLKRVLWLGDREWKKDLAS